MVFHVLFSPTHLNRITQTLYSQTLCVRVVSLQRPGEHGTWNPHSTYGAPFKKLWKKNYIIINFRCLKKENALTLVGAVLGHRLTVVAQLYPYIHFSTMFLLEQQKNVRHTWIEVFLNGEHDVFFHSVSISLVNFWFTGNRSTRHKTQILYLGWCCV